MNPSMHRSTCPKCKSPDRHGKRYVVGEVPGDMGGVTGHAYVCDAPWHDFRDGSREGDQQLPEKNDLPVIQELVQEDIQARLELGIKRYGTGLQPHNGRDALKDAYDEAMDLVMYLRQCMYERDGE